MAYRGSNSKAVEVSLPEWECAKWPPLLEDEPLRFEGLPVIWVLRCFAGAWPPESKMKTIDWTIDKLSPPQEKLTLRLVSLLADDTSRFVDWSEIHFQLVSKKIFYKPVFLEPVLWVWDLSASKIKKHINIHQGTKTKKGKMNKPVQPWETSKFLWIVESFFTSE
jgi:hypothetical protein